MNKHNYNSNKRPTNIDTLIDFETGNWLCTNPRSNLNQTKMKSTGGGGGGELNNKCVRQKI